MTPVIEHNVTWDFGVQNGVSNSASFYFPKKWLATNVGTFLKFGDCHESSVLISWTLCFSSNQNTHRRTSTPHTKQAFPVAAREDVCMQIMHFCLSLLGNFCWSQAQDKGRGILFWHWEKQESMTSSFMVINAFKLYLVYADCHLIATVLLHWQ